jgi:hypothetical protein
MREILVAPARQAQDDELGVEAIDAGERMRRLEGWQDPLGARQAAEGV